MMASQEDETLCVPEPHEALAGEYGFNPVWVYATVSKEPYRCRECDCLIPAGRLHAIFRYLYRSQAGWDHHHIHTDCAEGRIIPDMTFRHIVRRTSVPTQNLAPIILKNENVKRLRRLKPRSKGRKRKPKHP